MRLELTKRSDYAIRAMLALARAPDADRLSVRRLAGDQAIPMPFLSRLMGDVVRAGLVDGTPGRGGGYRLAQPADRISLLDVIAAVEGDSERRSCVLRSGPCGRTAECDVHAVFQAGQEALRRTFAEATLAELVGRRGRSRGSHL